MIPTTDEHGLTRNINSPTRYAREKIVRPKGDKNLNYPNLHGGMVTTTLTTSIQQLVARKPTHCALKGIYSQQYQQ